MWMVCLWKTLNICAKIPFNYKSVVVCVSENIKYSYPFGDYKAKSAVNIDLKHDIAPMLAATIFGMAG